MNNSWMAKAFALLTVCMLIIMPFSATAMAQATTGTLRGTVADPNGGVIAGANVTVKNEATGGVSPTVTSTGEGTFEIAGHACGPASMLGQAARDDAALAERFQYAGAGFGR